VDCGSSNCCWTTAVPAAAAAAAAADGDWTTTTTRWAVADSFSVWVEVRVYKVLIWAGVMAFYGRRDVSSESWDLWASARADWLSE